MVTYAPQTTVNDWNKIMNKPIQNSKDTPLKSTESTEAVMQDVLSLAQRLGASDASVSIQGDHGFSVDVRMGAVETLAFHESCSLGVTIYQGHCRGSASTSDMSLASIEATVTAANDIAKITAADPCFGLADKALILTEPMDLDLYHPWEVTPDEAIHLALDCEREALALDKRIVNSDGANVSTYTSFSGFADSFGRREVVQSSRHTLSLSLIASEAGMMQRDYDYTTARRVELLQNPAFVAKTAVERALSRLGARKIKTQKAPVLFSSRLSSSLFSSLIGAISGSNLYRKHSFLLDALDTEIFPSYIQVYEKPHIKGALGSAMTDDDGVPTRDNVFIKNGVLTQFALGCYDARRLNLKTTANSGGVCNLTIDATAGDLPALIKIMGRGLLVTELMGQGLNLLTGDYSQGACGFWVEDGKIQFPVEEVTIAGRLQDIYKHVIAVGSDVNPNYSTRCGSVLIEEMTIAGE